jgi:hypothetical protein
VALVGPAAAGEDAQAVGEAGLQPVEPEDRQPGRRQLDGQRHAVERPAHLRHPPPVGRPLDRRAHGLGPGEEQRHRVAGLAGAAGVTGAVDIVRERQPGDGERALERQHQADAAGGQHGQRRAPGQQALDEDGDAVHQVLAVVEDQQGAPGADGGGEAVLQRAARLLAHAEGGGHGGRDHPRRGHRHEVDVPDATGEAAGHLPRHRERQAGLADAAGPEGGHQPLGLHRPGQVGPLGCPPDERRERRRQHGRGRGVRTGDAPVPRGRRPRGWAGRPGLGQAGQRPPVLRPQLAEEARHVALDRAHGDEQALRDLRVGEVLTDRHQHFRLPGGDAGLVEVSGQRHERDCAGPTRRARRAFPPRTAQSVPFRRSIRGVHGCAGPAPGAR